MGYSRLIPRGAVGMSVAHRPAAMETFMLVAASMVPYITRIAAACLATLMGGAVATLALRRKPAFFPSVAALLLIAWRPFVEKEMWYG